MNINEMVKRNDMMNVNRMEKKRKRLLAMVALMLLTALFCKTSVFAAESKIDSIKKKQILPLTKNSYYRIWELDKKGSIVKNSLKVSKPSVLQVKTVKEGSIPKLYLAPRKTGKTKISFKYKYGGRTKTCKFNIKVVKYTNPFSKLMIGSKNYARHFKNSTLEYGTGKEVKGTIQVVPASGWICEYITYTIRIANNTNYYDFYRTGITVNIPRGGDVTVYMHNTVHNYDETFTIRCR